MRKLWLLICVPLVMGAADISGKWSGSIEIADADGGNPITTEVRAEFSQKADLVSGTIGRQEDERSESIRNGRVEGSQIFFEVSSPETLSAMKFNLTLRGDHLEGEMKGMVDSGEITGKVRLTRAAAGRSGASRAYTRESLLSSLGSGIRSLILVRLDRYAREEESCCCQPREPATEIYGYTGNLIPKST